MKTTKIETNSYQGVYQLPLSYDGMGYVWSKKDVMTLMFDKSLSEESRIQIVKSLNKESDLKIEGITNDDVDFFINGKYAFCVRGWGHLTGIGAMNLTNEKAIEIQDGFINYILERLKK